MSSFVMEEKFFNQLAAEMYGHATLRHSKLQWAVEYVLGLRAVPENRYEQEIRKFAQQCCVLNVEAVNHRYQQNDPAPELRFTKASGLPRWTDEQLIKHLECLSYQCAEGDREKSEVYQKIEKLIGHVARSIVGQSERYDLAPWDYKAA